MPDRYAAGAVSLDLSGGSPSSPARPRLLNTLRSVSPRLADPLTNGGRLTVTVSPEAILARNPDSLRLPKGWTIFGQRPCMQDIVCPRCRRRGLVRFETVIKAGTGYKTFYCGRCDYTWRSPDVAHGIEPFDETEDKPEPSRPTNSHE